jgi:hypothetical protein
VPRAPGRCPFGAPLPTTRAIARFYDEISAKGGGRWGNGHPIPDEIVLRRQEVFIAMKELNRKGVA